MNHDSLPPPVAHYLRHVLRERQPLIREARLRQVGSLRTDIRSSSSARTDIRSIRWLPFEARQVVEPLSPAFTWDARVTILPFVHVRVRDSYSKGQGSGRVSLLSIVTLAADSGHPEHNSGALHRYLAEAVWYPTALLPSAALSWSPLSDNTAVATLTDSGVVVSLEFRFNGQGEVTGIYSPGRWGRFEGRYRQAPWEGHFDDYQERDGVLVPSSGEVGWYLGDEWQSVWKGRVTEAKYEFVAPSR